jgi:hypothetical protein
MERRVPRTFSLTLTDGMPFPSHHIHYVNVLASVTTRIAAVPLFPGLRRFPEGRGFKQWTGDDSKALMKVCPFLRRI